MTFSLGKSWGLRRAHPKRKIIQKTNITGLMQATRRRGHRRRDTRPKNCTPTKGLTWARPKHVAMRHTASMGNPAGNGASERQKRPTDL